MIQRRAIEEKASLDAKGFGDASGSCRIDEWRYVRPEGEGQGLRHIYSNGLCEERVHMIYGA